MTAPLPLPDDPRPSAGTQSLCEARCTSARTDDEGVLRIVTTDEYEAKRGPGIGAPYPGCDHADLYPWGDDERVYYRPTDDDEWVELERLPEGGTFPLRPGSSVRLESPPSIRLVM